MASLPTGNIGSWSRSRICTRSPSGCLLDQQAVLQAAQPGLDLQRRQDRGLGPIELGLLALGCVGLRRERVARRLRSASPDGMPASAASSSSGGFGSSGGRSKGEVGSGGTELGVTVMPSSTPPTPPGGPILTVALLKKSASPFLVSSLALLISQSSRKNAIIAVTKSA